MLRGTYRGDANGGYAWVLEIRVGLMDPIPLTSSRWFTVPAPPTDLRETARRVGLILGREVEERLEG